MAAQTVTATERAATAGAGWPWTTAVVVAAAIVVECSRPLGHALVYDRGAVLDGQWWRLLTCHWVHFSLSHLVWNAVVLALAGGWCERRRPEMTRGFYSVSPLAIGLTLLVFAPSLARYGGLSGIASGAVVLLALEHGALARRPTTDRAARWIWRGVLVAVALKIVLEALRAHAVFAGFADAAIRAVPLAHVAGAAVALALYVLTAARATPRR